MFEKIRDSILSLESIATKMEVLYDAISKVTNDNPIYIDFVRDVTDELHIVNSDLKRYQATLTSSNN